MTVGADPFTGLRVEEAMPHVADGTETCDGENEEEEVTSGPGVEQ